MSGKAVFRNEYLVHICAVLFIGTLCCININKLNHISLLEDEFGYWSFAASIAGYDWKELLAETSYYAWGYSLWLVPIAAFLPTPELWYKVAVLLNVIFLCCAYFLCYFSGKRLFPNENKILIGLASIVATIYPSNIVYAQIAWTENLKYLMMWVATYLVIRLDEEFTVKNFVLLAVAVVYSYAVHASNIGLIMAGIICIGLILLKHKRKIWYLLLFIGLAIVGYKGCDIIKNLQISMLYDNSPLSNINNFSVNTATVVNYIQRIMGQVKMLIISLGGKYIYLLIGTGLTLPIVVVRTVEDVAGSIHRKNIFEGYNISRFWCVLALGIMWGLCAIQMMRWTNRKDLVIYGRYMENAIGPVLFLGIMYAIILVRETRLGLGIAVISCMAGIYTVYFCTSIADGGFNRICIPVMAAFFRLIPGDEKYVFLYLTLIMSALAVILLLSTLVRDRRRKAGIVLISLGMLFGILGYQSSMNQVDAKGYIDSMTVPLREKIAGEYKDRELYYVKNIEVDPYSMDPKYFQFLIPERPIHVIAVDDLEKIRNQKVLIMVNDDDNATIDILDKDWKTEIIDSSDLMNVYAVN